MTGSYIKEAIATLNATWLELRLAKLFGKKSKHSEGTITVELSFWNGKVYLLDMSVGSCPTCDSQRRKVYGENNEWCENCVPY